METKENAKKSKDLLKGYVVNWDGSANILVLGIVVGLVLFAPGYLLGSGLRALSATHKHDTNETKAA